jgi:hypothetical protein
MAKTILKTETSVGEFTRTTDNVYTHVCVRVPVEGVEAFRAMVASRIFKGGVIGRYVKDNGYVVSWHKTEAAARKEAAKGRKHFYITTDVLGVFPVAAA